MFNLMNRFFKSLSITRYLRVGLIGVGALVLSGLYSSPSQASLLTDSVRYKNNETSYIWAGLGFLNGNVGIGGDYEQLIDDDLGWGGEARFYSEGSTFIGNAFFRMHFPHYSWNLYFSPGLGLASGKNGATNISGLALTTAMAGMYSLNRSVSLGVETRNVQVISGDYKGNLVEMMFKARFSY